MPCLFYFGSGRGVCALLHSSYLPSMLSFSRNALSPAPRIRSTVLKESLPRNFLFKEQDFIKLCFFILPLPPARGSLHEISFFLPSTHFYSQLLHSPGPQNSMQLFLSPLWRAAEPVNCILNEALQCLAVTGGAHSFPESCQIRGVRLWSKLSGQGRAV